MRPNVERLVDEIDRLKAENKALSNTLLNRETDFPAKRMLAAIKSASLYDPMTLSIYISKVTLMSTQDGAAAFRELTE